MARARIDRESGERALASWRSSVDRGALPRDTIALAVRYLLQTFADVAKGGSVELRVPPYGAVQCIEGPGHTRGTPPNVVEMDAATWLALATGELSWEDGIGSGRVRASGLRADLTDHLPVV